jgi:murein DD-endopeptidase MepM/ murein hydrolase activator NlpD
MAKCGKPVVAAQPGRVQLVDYHGAAGNYVVIDGKGELEDTVYMHLASAANVDKRDTVSAGQVIGRVGTTGRSSACHLHFEMWDGAGWYEGGSPIDPKPFLQLWDRKRR